jgi:PAS domain S-box-containing protein
VDGWGSGPRGVRPTPLDPRPTPLAGLSARLQELADDAVVLLGVDRAEIDLLGTDGNATQRVIGVRAPDCAAVDGDRTSARPPLVAATPLVDGDGGILGCVCLYGRLTHPLTDRDQALLRVITRAAVLRIANERLLEQLEDQDARHRFLLDRLPDAIWAAGADRVFTYLSAGIERIAGYRPEELLGKSSQIVMHESSLEAFEGGYRWQIAHPDGDQTYRVNLRHKDGHPVPVELHNIGTPVDGRYGGGTGSVREISERLRLEREIEQQAAELAAGRERARLAQELHDSVTQALFSMTLTAGAARRLLEQHKPGVATKLDELSELTQEALAEMRSLIFELRPGNLGDDGLILALRKHIAAVQGRTGLIIRLHADPNLGRLPFETEDALYRIAQEAIHNVVKHASAREVEVRLGRRATEIEMEVRDDGAGFDARTRSDGQGLPGMAARAERVGGCVTVDTSRGRGTRVTVVLPLPADDEAAVAVGTDVPGDPR